MKKYIDFCVAGFVAPVSCIAAIICVAGFFVGCAETPNVQSKRSEIITESKIIDPSEIFEWEAGNEQQVILIEATKLKEWLDKAKDKEIVDMTALTFGKVYAASSTKHPFSTYSQTSSMLIVYKQLKKSEFENQK